MQEHSHITNEMVYPHSRVPSAVLQTRRSELFFVTALLLFAAALRFIGIAYGQPQLIYHPTDAARGSLPLETPIHPDEYFYVAIPMQMLVNRDFEPHFYENPSFLINLDALTYWLTGVGNSYSQELYSEIGQRQYAPFPFYVIARVYSALGGLTVVAVTYATARLLGGRFAAACAGVLAAVALPLVQHAHYATTSSLAAGFTMVAVWASFVSLKTGRAGWFALAGITSGFAISNRYNAAAILIILLAVGAILIVEDRRLWRSVAAGWALAPIGFLIGTPGAVTDLRQFWSDFLYIVGAYSAGGQVDYATPYGLFFEYRYLILFGIGVPAALAVLLGLIGCIQQNRYFRLSSPFVCALLLVIYLLAYSLVVLRTVRPGHSDQLLVPLIPVLCIFAGLGTNSLYQRLPISKIVLAPTLIVGLTMIPLTLSVPVVRMLSLPDTRLVMQAWIYERLPPGTRIHLAGPYNVPLDPALYPSTQDYAGQHTPLEELIRSGVSYVLVSDAYLHDLERSFEIVPADLMRTEQAAFAEYEALPVVASLERPQIVGNDWMMHTATIWHSPRLTLYCIRCPS